MDPLCNWTSCLQSVINEMPELSTRIHLLSMKHMLIDVADMEEANLLPYFQQAVQYISSSLATGGNVLVHCQAGVSRSASVSLAVPNANCACFLV